MKQEWYCENCRTVGVVKMPKHLDAMSGVSRVRDAHSKVRPECCDSSKIRVRGPECTQREWDLVSQKRENAMRDKATDRLLVAAGQWIKSRGGTALVAGGVGIIPPDPFGLKFNYSLVVRITGHPPKLGLEI